MRSTEHGPSPVSPTSTLAVAVRPATRLALSFALLVLLLSACRAGGDADVAATVTGEPIPVAAVESRFESVTRSPLFADELDADEDGTLATEVQASILTELIRAQLWEQGAAELDIEVADADVAARREQQIEEVGGQEAFDEQVERFALDERDLAAVLRNRVVRERVQERLVADVEEEIGREPGPEDETEAVQRWVAEQVREADVEVSPRFGEWDTAAGRVDPAPALGTEQRP